MNTILPVLDTAILQEEANKAAMKGAIKVFDDFYNGYNSPYKKAIEEDLKAKKLGANIQLPDIIGILNESLSAEVDRLANTAISKSFLPLVQKFLTRTDPEIPFSAILKEFIECIDDSDLDPDDYTVEIKEDARYEWLDIKVGVGKQNYSFTLHFDYKSKKEGLKKYKLPNLPYTPDSRQKKMKLSIGDASLELPFTTDILKDDFMSYMARIVISESLITMDMDYFDDSLFPERCHC
jgi:hypothetical protein